MVDNETKRVAQLKKMMDELKVCSAKATDLLRVALRWLTRNGARMVCRVHLHLLLFRCLRYVPVTRNSNTYMHTCM